MGGLRQAPLRRAGTGSQVSGPLHAPRCYFQSATVIDGGWPSHLRMEGYAAGNQTKTMTLEAVEFIRRFLLHVLPSGFVHIRHFGFLANRIRKQKLALCRSLLLAPPVVSQASTDSPGSNDSTSEQQFRRCPACKTGRLIRIEALTAAACACLPLPMITDTS